MFAFNLLPWRSHKRQQLQVWVFGIWLSWGSLMLLGWGWVAVELNQAHIQLQQAQQRLQWTQPPSPHAQVRLAWQQAPLMHLHDSVRLWSVLAEITPPQVTLTAVRWQQNEVFLSGVAQQADALALMLNQIVQQPELAAPQWRHWQPEPEVGTHFELALQWLAKAPTE
jgi:Tfp pilus assembly protein PilN